MFNKTKQDSGFGIPEPAPTPSAEPQRADTPTPRPAAPAPSAARSSNLSTLSAGVKYEGNISGGGDLQIDGSLKGDVRVARVTIGENGSVEGSVAADVLEIRGRVSGSIVAKQVRLHASARVDGDITQEQLSIEQGAWFQGRCTQAKRDAGAQPAVDRYKPEAAAKPAPMVGAAKDQPAPAAKSAA
jgi:cytoskeletal protein CcmA (bactofilin family)